jgi:hypothetical protein
VVGDPAGEAVPAVGERGVGGQGLGQSPVHPGALPGEEGRRHRLVQQGVPEDVRVPVGNEDVPVDGRTQRIVEGLVRELHRVGQQAVFDAPADCGCGADEPARARRERVDAGLQQVADRDGDDVGVPERDQLLGEERVSLGARVDLVQPGAGRRDPDDAAQLQRLFVAGERSQLDAECPGRRQLREEPGDGVLRVGLVGPGGEQQERARRQPAGQEPQQVAGRPVRPVHVLHEQEQRTSDGQTGEQRAERRVQPARARLGDVGRPGGVGVRQQPREFLTGRPAEGPDAGRAFPVRELGQDVDERGVGEDVGADLDAPAGQQFDVLDTAQQLADQPGLAEAGLTGDDGARAAAGEDLVQDAAQLAQLLAPPDQGGAGDAGHGSHGGQLSAATPPRDSGSRPTGQWPSWTGVSSSASSPCASRCTRAAVSASGASTRQKTRPEPSSNQYCL